MMDAKVCQKARSTRGAQWPTVPSLWPPLLSSPSQLSPVPWSAVACPFLPSQAERSRYCIKLSLLWLPVAFIIKSKCLYLGFDVLIIRALSFCPHLSTYHTSQSWLTEHPLRICHVSVFPFILPPLYSSHLFNYCLLSPFIST